MILKLEMKNLIISLLVAFNTASITYVVLSQIYISRKINAPYLFPQPLINAVSVISQEPIKEEPDNNLKSLNVLLLGYGGAGHPGGYLTDAIQVLNLDFPKKTASVISIPRDLWIKSENGRETKINSFLNGPPDKRLNGIDILKSAIFDITGLNINYFIAVDFVGFMRTIGIELKGIEVEVSETLDDPLYPISGEEVNPCGYTAQEVATITSKYSGLELERKFPCRYEHLRFEKGLVHMEGGDALKYVRSRHGSSEGDISRGKRQQEVLIAIKNKLLSLDTLNNIPGIYQSLVKHVQTDVTLESAKFLAPFLTNFKEFKLVTVNLGPGNVLAVSTSSDKQAIIIPKEGISKWDKVKEYVKEQTAQ